MFAANLHAIEQKYYTDISFRLGRVQIQKKISDLFDFRGNKTANAYLVEQKCV